MRPFYPFFLAVAAITAVMSPMLVGFVRFSFNNELYSHLLLIPIVCAYLAWIKRPQTLPQSPPNRLLAIAPLVLAGLALGIRQLLPGLAVEDKMAAVGATFVMLIWAAACLTLGTTILRALVFPLVFLVAMIPFPLAVENGIEWFLQRGSAECAYWLFRMSGLSLLRDKLIFVLPSISLQVAPECSGIRSSLVLLITSLVGGCLFLRSAWTRAILAIFVVPLALMRNGFRVFVLGELCEKIGRHMINSYIHHHGGPIFFALSLIPFTAVMWLLVNWESKHLVSAKPPLAASAPPAPESEASIPSR